MAHNMTPLGKHQICQHHDPFPFTLLEQCLDGQARWVPPRCMICTPRAQRDDIVVGKTWSLVNLSTTFIRGTM